MFTRISRVLLALAVLGAASPASAQATRVVMTHLEGRNAAAAERVIIQGLEERGLTIVRSDATPSSDAEAAAVVGDAHAVIGGSAVSRGQRWRAQLWVRTARGAAAGEVRRRVQGARGVRRVVADLASALEGVSVSGGTAPVSTAPVSTAPVSTAPVESEPASAEPEEPATAESAAPTSSDEPAPSRDELADGEAETLPITATFLVGAGIRTRAFELRAPDGLDAGYRAEPYFELVARATARFFDVLFVRAVFGSSVGLESRREGPMAGNVESWFAHFLGDVGASYIADEMVELGVAFGVGWDRYGLPFDELVPTAEYVHLRPALVTGFRLVGEHLVLDAEVGVRVPLTVGDLEALHGSDRRGIGLDGVVRLGGVIALGITWSLEAGARHYWLRFRRAPSQWVNGFDAGWHATGFLGWTL